MEYDTGTTSYNEISLVIGNNKGRDVIIERIRYKDYDKTIEMNLDLDKGTKSSPSSLLGSLRDPTAGRVIVSPSKYDLEFQVVYRNKDTNLLHTATGFAKGNVEYAKTDGMYSFTYDLPRGHNLISFPLELEDTRIENIFEPVLDKLKKVVYYEKSHAYICEPPPDYTNTYFYPIEAYIPVAPCGAPANSLTHIDNQHGYWVSFLSPVTFTIRGKIPEEVTISLEHKYTYISYVGITPSRIQDIPSFRDPAMNGVRIQKFIPPQNYLMHEIGNPFNQDFQTLEPGEGYIVYIR
jgi:hypothetical protein